MALNLSSLESILSGAQKNCQALNAEVATEWAARSAAQRSLQSSRNTASAASQALALLSDAAYTNTTNSSRSDLMTTASSVPAVVQMTPSSVVADNAMKTQLAAAASSIGSVATTAANATNPVTAASALSSVSSALASNTAVQDAGQLNRLSQSNITGSLENLATTAADVYLQQQTCGMLDAATARNAAGLLYTGAKKIANKGTEALSTGIADTAPATAQNGQLASQDTTNSDALKATQLAAVDTTNANSLALSKQTGSAVGSNILSDLKSGLTSPDTVISKFNANKEALGKTLASYTGAATANVPSIGQGISQLTTDKSLGNAALLNTAGQYATNATCVLSKATALFEQAKDTYQYKSNTFIDMAETTVQTKSNIDTITLCNGAESNSSIILKKDTTQNTITSSQTDSNAGVSTSTTDKDHQGSIGSVVNNATHTDDVSDKSKWLTSSNQTTREVSAALKDNCCDMTNYNKLSTTGIKYANATLGTERQEQLTSVSQTAATTSNANTCERTIKKTRKSERYTTSSKSNKYNVYSYVSYAI